MKKLVITVSFILSTLFGFGQVGMSCNGVGTVCYPNPTTDRINVRWDKPGYINYELVDGKGSIVRQDNLSYRPYGDYFIIDVLGLSNGMYRLNVWVDGNYDRGCQVVISNVTSCR